MGDMVHVELPSTGTKVTAGKECGVVESVKAASDVYAPVTGEVVARNDALAEAPGEVNNDPYAAWLFRIKPAEAGRPDNLMDAQTYRKSFSQA